jgi:hypothetical protein
VLLIRIQPTAASASVRRLPAVPARAYPVRIRLQTWTPLTRRSHFKFSGSTFSVDGTFSIDLGNFVTGDGSSITGVSYASGNLHNGDFSNVSWNGTDAIFTGTANSGYNAINGSTVVFDVTTVAAAPEPASFALLGSALVGLGLMRRRMKSGR